MTFLSLVLILLIPFHQAFAQGMDTRPEMKEEKSSFHEDPEDKKEAEIPLPPEVKVETEKSTALLPQKKVIKRYQYFDRDHTNKEVATHLGVAYGLMVGGYLATQWETIQTKGSWNNYGNNFGDLGNDKDNPIWNLVGHPYTGSQTYLYYRALGYDRLLSVQMAFWTSALFETTIEIYTEKASVQDLYQTPILGSALGYLFEKTSLFLLNNDNSTAFKALGYVINPMLLFGFAEVETTLFPEITKERKGLYLTVSY